MLGGRNANPAGKARWENLTKLNENWSFSPDLTENGIYLYEANKTSCHPVKLLQFWIISNFVAFGLCFRIPSFEESNVPPFEINRMQYVDITNQGLKNKKNLRKEMFDFWSHIEQSVLDANAIIKAESN